MAVSVVSDEYSAENTWLCLMLLHFFGVVTYKYPGECHNKTINHSITGVLASVLVL